MSIRILLIDPHSIIRLGIVQTLIAADDFEVVADVESLDEGISRAKQTAPDVLVIDADLSSPSVFNRLAQLHSAMPELRTLLFTANDHAKIADHVIQCGATGYLIKAAGPEELALAIRSIHQGRLFISHSRSSVAPKSTRTKPAPSSSDGTPRRRNDGLSTREREVLQRLADGMTNKQVAAELFLSVKTVETYRARIMKKFALVDRVGLVQFARQTIQA